MLDATLSALGVVGVLMILTAYAGVQSDRLKPRSRPALLLNLVGPLLILASMAHGAFNLSAFLIEAAWAAIAAYGLWRAWRSR